MKMFRNPNSACKICGKRVYRRPSQITASGVYCSLICNGLSQRVEKKCKICSEKYIGNKKTCSRSCANKSRTGINYTKENKFNNAYKGTLLKEKVAQKRGGVCEKCHMENYAILQIHHKKERYKGGADAMMNLELLCPNCHTAHHLGNSLYKEK